MSHTSNTPPATPVSSAHSRRIGQPLGITLLVLITTSLGLGCAHAQQETARVVSSTPVMQQVAVPRQVCQEEIVTTPGQKSGAGALMGGIAGGAMGNAIGGGNGRAAATVLGLFGGAILGDKIEGSPAPESKLVQHCGTQTFYETRTVGYHVVYEYAGKQYSVQMPHDPGQFIQLQITPLTSGAAPTSGSYTTPAPRYQPESRWR